jgi:hypothetical protein
VVVVVGLTKKDKYNNTKGYVHCNACACMHALLQQPTHSHTRTQPRTTVRRPLQRLFWRRLLSVLDLRESKLFAFFFFRLPSLLHMYLLCVCVRRVFGPSSLITFIFFYSYWYHSSCTIISFSFDKRGANAIKPGRLAWPSPSL